MKPRHERRIRQLRDQLDRLADEHASWVEAAERAQVDLGETPRLRDRNNFVNSLLHADRADCDRIAPLWQEYRRCSREAVRAKKRLAAGNDKLDTAIRRGAARDAEYQVLQAKVNRQKDARRVCKQLTEAIREARGRISQAAKRRSRDEASNVAVDQDAREVSGLIKAVRKAAVDVNQKVSPHRSFDSNYVLMLATEFPDSKVDHKIRNQKYKDTLALLDSLEISVKSVLRDIAAREMSVESERRRYLDNERARFDDPTG